MTAGRARAGRERTCTQCDTVYRSPRASSRYCSPSCRKKAPYGSPSKSPRDSDVLLKRLVHIGLVGRIGTRKTAEGPVAVMALLVPLEQALAEVNARYNRPSVMRVGQFALSLREVQPRRMHLVAAGLPTLIWQAEPQKLEADLTLAEFKSRLNDAGVRPYRQVSEEQASRQRLGVKLRDARVEA